MWTRLNPKNRKQGKWRKERDSNPRSRFRLSGFQDRRIRPLCHPSGQIKKEIYR